MVTHVLRSGFKVRQIVGLPVYGGSERVNAVTNIVKDGEELSIGDNLKIRYVGRCCSPTSSGSTQLLHRCLATPCHTQDSICYYVTDSTDSAKAVFTGYVI